MQPHASPFLDSLCKSPSVHTPPYLPPVSLKPDVERHLCAVFGKALTVCLVELRVLRFKSKHAVLGLQWAFVVCK